MVEFYYLFYLFICASTRVVFVCCLRSFARSLFLLFPRDV